MFFTASLVGSVNGRFVDVSVFTELLSKANFEIKVWPQLNALMNLHLQSEKFSFAIN